MSFEEEKLVKILGEVNLSKYLANFLKEDIVFSDLDGISEEELFEVIPKKVHRRRLLKYLETVGIESEEEEKSEKNQEPKRKDKSGPEGEEMVHMHIKWENRTKSVYDVPLSSTNEVLIGKLLTAFFASDCEVLLSDRRVLASSLKSYSLKNWMEDNKMSSKEHVIRGSMRVNGISEVEEKVEEERLRREIAELKLALAKESNQKNVIEEKMVKRIQQVLELKTEKGALEKKLKAASEEIKKLKAKGGRTSFTSSTFVKSTNSSEEFLKRGDILIPNPTTFHFVDSGMDSIGVFSSDLKKAVRVSKNAYCVFKTNVLLKAGFKYFYEVKVGIRMNSNNWVIGLGVIGPKEKLIPTNLGKHTTGWEIFLPQDNPYLFSKGKKHKANYGPTRVKGDHTIGVLVDFSNGRCEMSFTVNGLDYGVAFKDVVPPVSPAFYFFGKGDSFELSQEYELPEHLAV